LVGASLAGCGGGLPLLHPAAALEAGDVEAAAGLSANIAAGGVAGALDDAKNDTLAHGGAPQHDATFARGALALASIGPGLAPWVAARVGIGSSFDVGLGYSGRAVRADVRRSFPLSPGFAASVGAGGLAVVGGQPEGGDLPGVDVASLHGGGADVPVVVGFESDGQFYRVWIGARAGWEHVEVSGTPWVAALRASRLWAGGLVGLAVGFRHLYVAVEFDASYASVAGDYADVHTRVEGLVVAPATALWWHF
jgi:hypothetical protein